MPVMVYRVRSLLYLGNYPNPFFALHVARRIGRNDNGIPYYYAVLLSLDMNLYHGVCLCLPDGVGLESYRLRSDIFCSA